VTAIDPSNFDRPVPIHPTDGPIHGWFGLSYSSYAVLSRTLMQSMPIEWQERMVACLDEIHDAFRHVEQAEGYEVHAATGHELVELTDEQRAALGFSEVWYDDEEPTGLEPAALAEWQDAHELPDAPVFHDANGNEVSYSHFVQLRCDDPLPHYRHAYIEPRVVPAAKPAAIDDLRAAWREVHEALIAGQRASAVMDVMDRYERSQIPTGAPATPVCRCGADPVHQMGCDAEWADQ